MVILQSVLLNKFSEIKFGLSTKIGLNRKAPHYFNTSKSVDDDEIIVEENRNVFYRHFGLLPSLIALQKQEHTDTITIVEKPGFVGESDALITNKPNIGLVISTADCGNIFIYDKKNKVIAGVHSGWRGTQKQILYKTISIMKDKFNSNPQDLFVYVGPSISKDNFEVKEDVLCLFDNKYISYQNGKCYIDITLCNLDMLYNNGIPNQNIQVSQLCSYREQNLLHSYRRDGKHSGRAFGLIVLKEYK
ncbi:MAG: peptidoglycan editing factor PgeF [bacterium]